MNLTELKGRVEARVESVRELTPNDAIARRLRELGFVAGERVEVVATGPFGAEPLLVQIGLAVSEMPVAQQPVSLGSTPSVEQQALQPLVRPEVPVADDVLELRDTLDEAIYTASLKADPAHYLVLNQHRQALIKHLTAVAASGVRLVDVTPPETLSVLVLAYRRFGDATRASEVVQRNRIRHPGFVPSVPIKLAQR